MSGPKTLLLILLSSLLLFSCNSERADSASARTAGEAVRSQGVDSPEEAALREWNHGIRQEKFDLVLPDVMRKNQVDMWIHVMRETIPDPFGAEELGSTSGVFVFTDKGEDRIERAVLGRRWGASHAGKGKSQRDEIIIASETIEKPSPAGVTYSSVSCPVSHLFE